MSSLQRFVNRFNPMPRPPIPDAPLPGTFYLTFQRQLAASEQLKEVARALAHCHWLYEGWTGLALPLTGDLQRIYTKAACYAVRCCSEPERQVAVSRAERWGVSEFERLLLSLQGVRGELREATIRTFIKSCLDVERGALMNGVEVMTPQEDLLLAEMDEAE